MNVFTMGWRNVWRNRRRSVTAIAAMAFALWVELLYAGIVPGYMQDMESAVIELEIGDIQIHASGYLDRPSLYKAIESSSSLVEKLEQAGLEASPRLLGGGLAASGEFSSGVSLRGLDVAREAAVSKIHEKIDQGSWLDPADPQGVVLGKLIARTLGASPGSELIVVSQAADGSMANELYTVRGVLKGIAQGTDRSAVLMNAAAFRELMSFPEGAHQVVVRRGQGDLTPTAQKIRTLAPELDVKTWKELMPVIAQMLEATRGMIYIMFFIIYIAVGILILNAMLTAVFERIREFGVLKAIGAGPLRVLSLILVESSIQTFVAMVVGVVLALPGMWYIGTYGINTGALGGMDAMGIAMSEVWYGIYTPQNCVGPIILLWIVVMGAVLVPAVKAASIDPIRAMRHR